VKIATYNIWNNDFLFRERTTAICEAINEVQADIICLQEVRNDKLIDIVKTIAEYANYPFFTFQEYPDCADEGLAILSKFELYEVSSIWQTSTDIANYCAIRALINYNEMYIGITNLHLNWRSEEIRLRQLNEVNSWVNSKSDYTCHEIICGDFNDVPNSNVYEFLINSGWKNALKLSKHKNIDDICTFDLVNNPYLKDDVRPKEKLQFDWILVKEYNDDMKINIKRCNIFGNKYLNSKPIPSDHYGVYIEIK
jgi:endonuclease/exonuclease/phosphatase family metal-dependent hydrolase